MASVLIEDLAKRFNANLRIQQVVGNRVFIGRAPQGQRMPYIRLYEVFSEPQKDLQGEIEISRSTIQVDAWADGPNALILTKRLSRHIRETIDNLHDEIRSGGGSAPLATGGLAVQSCAIVRNDMLGERPSDGSDNYLRRNSIDIDFIHEDPIVESVVE